MSAEWKTTIKVVIACAILGACIVSGAALYNAISAGKRSNATLSADRDTYKRASEAYARSAAELKAATLAAQERAVVAENATRTATSEFNRYKGSVVGRDRAIRDRIDSCISSLDGCDDSLDRCIKLADLCISIDKLIEPSAY